MSNGPPELSRNSETRDTLEISVDELARESQLPIHPSAHTPPPLPPQARQPSVHHERAEVASRAAPPSSLAPTAATADSGNTEDFAPAFRVTLAIAGILVFAVPFFLGAGSSSHSEPASTAAGRATTAVTAPTGLPVRENTEMACTEATALEPEQLIELDSVRVARSRGMSETTTPHRKGGVASIPKQRFFDPSAAESAVQAIGGTLRECGPEARGKVDVAVTFAPSGSATVATVEEDRLRATPAGSCVARRLREAQMPEFNGNAETVRTTLRVD
jgi:hypothetical protein